MLPGSVICPFFVHLADTRFRDSLVFRGILELAYNLPHESMMNEKKKRIRNEIITLYNGLLKKPCNVAKEHPRLYSNARKVFGSWKKALEASEIDYEKARNHKKWSREKVAKEIKRLYLSGHTLRPKDLKKGGATRLISAANYHFGSWSKAVKHSGVYYSFERNNKKTGETDICYNELRTKQGLK